MTYDEPFGPEYVRPKNPACPDCSCCTAVLCEKGRASLQECAGHVDGEELIDEVTDCPCSAELTPGTLSWRAAMVRAVTFATEKPLREELEELLRRVAAGEPSAELADLLPKLAVRRYVNWRGGLTLQATDFGRAYLDARRPRQRVTVPVTVRTVDVEARTAVVFSPMFRGEGLVTVPMDQVIKTRTGLTAERSSWVELRAEANPNAELDAVVLTKVYNPRMPLQQGPEAGR